MASKYIKMFKVPKNFENILSDFAKEVLRNQPKDILDFGIEYFKGLETNTKLDYPDKGENRPENYKAPENKEPNIINAPNNMDISQGDRNRLKISMDKIERINRDPVPSENKVEVENVGTTDEKEPKHDVKPNANGRYGGGESEKIEEDKKNYDEWFTRHSIEGKPINYVKENTPLDENLKKNEGEYDNWFRNHSVKSINQSQSVDSGKGHKDEKLRDDNPKEPQEEEKKEKGKDEKDYDKWFNKHSNSNSIIDYKKEEEPLDENLKRNEVGYNAWFKNHSVKSIDQSQSAEAGEKDRPTEEAGENDKPTEEAGENDKPTEEAGEKFEYNEWFDKHSKDRMVIEYKQEKIEMENIERNEVDYEAWFKNHSKLTNKTNQ